MTYNFFMKWWMRERWDFILILSHHLIISSLSQTIINQSSHLSHTNNQPSHLIYHLISHLISQLTISFIILFRKWRIKWIWKCCWWIIKSILILREMRERRDGLDMVVKIYNWENISSQSTISPFPISSHHSSSKTYNFDCWSNLPYHLYNG